MGCDGSRSHVLSVPPRVVPRLERLPQAGARGSAEVAILPGFMKPRNTERSRRDDLTMC